MADDAYNMSMRKFLKQVGVTSQQAIEEGLRKAAEAGTLDDSVEAQVVLTIPSLGVSHTISGEIKRGESA